MEQEMNKIYIEIAGAINAMIPKKGLRFICMLKCQKQAEVLTSSIILRR